MKPDESPAARGSARLLRRLLAVGFTLAAIAGVVFGISWLGDRANRELGSRDRYTVRFADIECNTPPGLERAAFLSEVRYVANAPDSFQSLDSELHAKLSPVFTAHPWVAAVEGASATAEGKVRVKLRFREPALAVRTEGGTVRVVDVNAVLLPPGAPAEGVPEMVTPITTAPPLAGKVWEDADVRRAVELVASHHPRKLEKTPQGWRLTTPSGRTLVIER